METNQAGIDLIKKWEGFYANAYDDGEGVFTIGYGTTRWDLKTPVKKGDKITEEEAERQLRKELQRVDDAIDKSVNVNLNANEHSSLACWGYNVGIGWITGEGHQQATLIKEINKGNSRCVPSELLKFVHGANTGKVYKGLLNRRKDEIRLWLTPCEDAVLEEPMPQAVTESRPAIVETAKDSKTVRWGIGAFVSWIGLQVSDAYHWVFGVIKDTGPEIISLKTQLSPFDPLLKITPTILTCAVLFCIFGVIAQRIADRGTPR